MNKRNAFVLATFLCAIIFYLGWNYLSINQIKGKYFLVNYEGSFAVPNIPDSLYIYDNYEFKSLRYGSGKFQIYHSIGITKIHLNTSVASDVLGWTYFERDLRGSVKIVMSKDEDVYYQKVK